MPKRFSTKLQLTMGRRAAQLWVAGATKQTFLGRTHTPVSTYMTALAHRAPHVSPCKHPLGYYKRRVVPCSSEAASSCTRTALLPRPAPDPSPRRRIDLRGNLTLAFVSIDGIDRYYVVSSRRRASGCQFASQTPKSRSLTYPLPKAMDDELQDSLLGSMQALQVSGESQENPCTIKSTHGATEAVSAEGTSPGIYVWFFTCTLDECQRLTQSAT